MSTTTTTTTTNSTNSTNSNRIRGAFRSVALTSLTCLSSLALASLFAPGGTHALKGEFHGIDDFEVLTYLVVLPQE